VDFPDVGQKYICMGVRSGKIAFSSLQD